MITIFKPKSSYNKFIITRRYIFLHINEKEEIIENETYITADEFSIRILHDSDDRGHIISSIIKAKYSQDRMDSIRNNYELVRDGKAGEKTEKYTEEYNAMQDWRQYAKNYADEIINSDDYKKYLNN